MLGFTINDSKYLKEEYENQAVKNYCDSKYKLGKLDSQGQRINIDIKFVKNGKILYLLLVGWLGLKEKLQIIHH